MKKLLSFLVALPLICSCLNLAESDPYGKDMHGINLQLNMPEGFEGLDMTGIEVTFKDNSNNASVGGVSDKSGMVSVRAQNGVWSATASGIIDYELFNGSLNGIIVNGADVSASTTLSHSRTGDLVIKEIYCGGCMKLPAQGTYGTDSYIILHNNSGHTVYLDSLCFATLDPYNSNSTSVWGTEIDWCPLIQAVWQIPGDGSKFPLGRGEDAVICVYGAIDHSAQYPLSVNLNKSGYFVCYNPVSFPNVLYHPAPGDQIQQDHILDLVLKMGKANAYTFSKSSPAVVIFKSQGEDIKDFVSRSGNVIQKPGSDDKVVCLPNDWVIDGIEVFNGQQTTNKKRLNSSIDAGYVTLTITNEGRTLMRKTNEEMSALLGFEVLMDTNNSSNDLYEREKQSLHE